MRYIAYMRKSTEQAERQSLSIPSQIRKIKETFPGVKIVKWFEESQSAYSPGRPKFNQMIEMLDSGEADGLISWHPDRLSRNELDAAAITYRIRKGVIKHTLFGSYTFENTPEGIMMLQSVMSHSQYYSSKLSKDVKRGNDEQRKRGWLTGRAPEGYLNQRSENGDSYGVVIADPIKFPLRRKMWDLMLTGNYGVPQILEIVNKWDYKTRATRRHPGGPISNTSLHNMFKNPRYMGRIPVPGQPGKTEKARFPAMVTEDEFNRVQEILRRTTNRVYITKKVFAFRGLVFCGECNCKITAEEKIRQYKNGTTRRYVYYHCTHRKQCSQRLNTREEELERQLEALIGKYTILPQFKDWALEVLKEQNEAELGDVNAIMANQNKGIETKHKQMKKLIDMAARELISEDEFVQQKKELGIAIVSLETELRKVKHKAESWHDTFARTFELAVHGRELFINGDINAKKEVLANIGQNLTLKDGRLEINAYPWLQLIEKEYPALEAAYEKVRTSNNMSLNAKIDAYASIQTTWLGMRDSNPRSRDQNPMPYRLANPQCGIDYNEKTGKNPA